MNIMVNKASMLGALALSTLLLGTTAEAGSYRVDIHFSPQHGHSDVHVCTYEVRPVTRYYYDHHGVRCSYVAHERVRTCYHERTGHRVRGHHNKHQKRHHDDRYRRGYRDSRHGHHVRHDSRRGHSGHRGHSRHR